MTTAGYMVLALGLLVGLYGDVRFLVVAYNRNLGWFFGCLFVPLAAEIFLVLNWRATARPFGVSLLGLAIAGLGCWLVSRAGL